MVNAVSIARYSAGNEKQYRKGKRIKIQGVGGRLMSVPLGVPPLEARSLPLVAAV